jgi:hypothetical protein
MTVTGYLRHPHPAAGWYDMQSAPNGGETWSVPEFAVDEASIADAPAETLTPDDWAEIRGHVAARLGSERADALLTLWREGR